MLLRHACESSTALHEGLDAGRIGLHGTPDDDDTEADPTRVFMGHRGKQRRAMIEKVIYASAARNVLVAGVASAALRPL